MIKGKCRTNLDGYYCHVDLFAALPRVNDQVAVFKDGIPTSLRVITITHCQDKEEPYILVELHH